MSQENVEVIRSLYEIGAGDSFSVAPDEFDRAFRDYIDEQFEVRLPPDYPEGEPVFRGREGFDELLAMLGDTWGKWRFEPERFLDAGDRVVVFVRILAEGGASGVPVRVGDDSRLDDSRRSSHVPACVSGPFAGPRSRRAPESAIPRERRDRAQAYDAFNRRDWDAMLREHVSPVRMRRPT